MKKLQKGDLCKIWVKDNLFHYGIFEYYEDCFNYFKAIHVHDDGGSNIMNLSTSKSVKVTVWKKSSFEKKIIKFGLVVKDGKFVDNKIIVKEMSDCLSKLFSGYSAKTLIEELASVREDFEKQKESINKEV